MKDYQEPPFQKGEMTVVIHMALRYYSFYYARSPLLAHKGVPLSMQVMHSPVNTGSQQPLPYQKNFIYCVTPLFVTSVLVTMLNIM